MIIFYLGIGFFVQLVRDIFINTLTNIFVYIFLCFRHTLKTVPNCKIPNFYYKKLLKLRKNKIAERFLKFVATVFFFNVFQCFKILFV